MSELVTELRIIGSECNIFDTDMEYTIPLYQRAFAWENKQLTQLIEDISDASEGDNYYIGSLIVSRQGNKFEVVDGQQRLTSMYLLLNCLDLSVRNSLTFACRDKSNYTLKNIKELLLENRSKIDMERIEPSIYHALISLKNELKLHYDKEKLRKKLEQVILYRIEVPENTDLNRYFEIMNTRGEQLEQHDILKAELMSYLQNDLDKDVFSKIWDACSDMTGYVQMHFICKSNSVRERIFGDLWNNMPSMEWSEYRSCILTESQGGVNYKIADIVNVNFEIDSDDGFIRINDDDVRVRFESVIDFPYFLLHVLKVLIGIQKIHHKDGSFPIIALDDKKLVDTFTRVIKFGVTDAGVIADNKPQFSKDFIICLLRTRFLFDQFIIKREYANENSDGEWSLKSLEVSGQQSKKKPYYRNSWESSGDCDVKTNTMIQSALRVSYTSPKVMHWITHLLLWLSEHTNTDDMVNYGNYIESIAKKAVVETFLGVCQDGTFAMGIDTPHIVFNYLDFLLWKSNRKKYDDFVFEFRNSVEHWYPQNPSEGTIEMWKDGVDQFGNLCIVQRNINSKFSNMAPEAKKSTFRDMISKGSLKLRIMSELTEKNGDDAASTNWRNNACEEHGDKMISILKNACKEL